MKSITRNIPTLEKMLESLPAEFAQNERTKESLRICYEYEVSTLEKFAQCALGDAVISMDPCRVERLPSGARYVFGFVAYDMPQKDCHQAKTYETRLYGCYIYVDSDGRVSSDNF